MRPPEQWNLTPRETDALDAICEHGKGPLAAKALGVAPGTVRDHINAAMRKAQVHSVVQLAVAWDRYSRPQRKAA